VEEIDTLDPALAGTTLPEPRARVAKRTAAKYVRCILSVPALRTNCLFEGRVEHS